MTQNDALTEKLLVRAELATHLLLEHLSDQGDQLLAGRVQAINLQTSQALKDWRAYQAQMNDARRRRHAIKQAATVIERHG